MKWAQAAEAHTHALYVHVVVHQPAHTTDETFRESVSGTEEAKSVCSYPSSRLMLKLVTQRLHSVPYQPALSQRPHHQNLGG